MARRVRARAVELPARDDVQSLQPVAATVLNVIANHSIAMRASPTTRRRRRASSPTRRCRCSIATTAIVRLMRLPGPHRCRRSARACRCPKRNGGSCDRDGRRRGSRAAASCWCRRRRCAGRPPQRAERARRARARRRRSPSCSAPVRDALAQFRGLPHRMQRDRRVGRRAVRQRFERDDGRRDRAALDGMRRPVVLIAGGDGKGQSFAPLKASRRPRVPRGPADRPRRRAGRARLAGTTGARRDRSARSTLPSNARVRAGARRRRRAAVARVREPRPVRELRRARRALRGARARPRCRRSQLMRKRLARHGDASAAARRSRATRRAHRARDARLRRVARVGRAAAARDRPGDGLLVVDRDGRGVTRTPATAPGTSSRATRCSSRSAWRPRRSRSRCR